MNGVVLVTPRSMSTPDVPALRPLFEAGYEILTPWPGRQPAKDELMSVVPEIVGWIAGVERIDADVIRHARSLRVISRNGAGYDNVDVSAARSAGIEVLPARGANARGVAELALALSIMGLRSLPEAMSSTRQGDWRRSPGRELGGRVLGIVGFGAIGHELARLGAAVGMVVIAHDPLVTEGDALVTMASLENVLRQADVVSLHVPPQPQGPLLGPHELSLLRDDAVLVNTARSTLVEEGALLRELENGRLAMYAVDAFDVEPPTLTRLLLHPRVVPTPHLGAATYESIERASTAAVTNLLGALARD